MFRQVLTSSTQPQIWPIHVVDRTRTPKKCARMQNACTGRVDLFFFFLKPIALWRSRCRRRCRSGVGSLISQPDRRATADRFWGACDFSQWHS